MNQTHRHGLSLLAMGQAQKEVTHNEALLAIDRRLQIAVASRGQMAPPDAPVAGEGFIVPAGAAGAWAGKDDQIATFDGFGWTFDPPRAGWLAWIGDEQSFQVFDGQWLAAGGIGKGGARTLPIISEPAGGEVVDAETREIVGQLLVALRSQGLIQ